jgi:hypothetical protein
MRVMLFFDGRYPRYAFPVLAEYADARLQFASIAPNFNVGHLEVPIDQPLLVHFRRCEAFRILCSFISLF